MCGRYVSARDPLDLAALLGAQQVEESAPADYNVAPTKPVPVVLERAADRVRVLTVAVWGWPGRGGRGPLFNVRSETVRDRAAFAHALATRRCLLPADGYYEWQAGPDGRQPYYLTPPDGAPLAIAGIYRHGATLAAAMLTGAATEELSWLHARTPLVVPPERWSQWLDPSDALAGPELLVPATALGLRVVPVSRAVNHADSSGPQLVDPLTSPVSAPTLW